MGRQTNRSRRAQEASARERAAEMRAAQQAAERRRRFRWYAGGGIALAVVVAVIAVAVVQSGGSGNGKESLPPAVSSGTPKVEPPALKVSNTTGIPGVVAYDTTGWPPSSHNGPAAQALGHNHVDGPVQYSVTPPVGGDHNATWMNCGVYDQPVPNERAVHNLEHGAIWITYQPGLPASEVTQLRNFEKKQSVLQGGSRYVDVTPFPGLPSPIVITSWGFQLQVTSPTDPRLQRFVNMFRFSRQYSPEYQGPCTGGVGTPLQK